jgi:hypothetical protein
MRFQWPWLRKRDGLRHCLFCLRSSQQVAPEDGVMGVHGFICRQCIALCIRAIAQEHHEWREEQIANMIELREREK